MFNYNTKKLFASAILFLVSILLSSCGVWTDFTTYFNTYYNARTLFDATEEQILAQNKDPFVFREETKPSIPGVTTQTQQTYRTQNQNTSTNQQNPNTAFDQTNQNSFNQQNQNTYNANSQNTQYNKSQTLSTTQLNQQLTKVIEKCSKILQFENESSYFDDALFMTGKAFYYQGEYARAQRKFIELSSLPETEYALENKLWLAKTYLQLRSFEEGLKLLEEVKTAAQEQEDKKLVATASITKIGFLIYREEYQAAINECNSYLENLDDEEMASTIWYQMGKIYLKQSDEENAIKAFSSVLEHSPTFEIEFESRLQHALLLKDLNRDEESEEALNVLMNEGKFKYYLDRIMVELGKIYYDKDDNEKAISIFLEVDSTYRSNPTAGTASFMLGKIYERKFGLYDSAYKYYNKTVQSLAPYETKLDAGNYVRNIDKYFSVSSTVREYQKSLTYLTQPTRFMQDSIDYELAHKEFMVDVKHRVDSIQAQGNQNQISSEPEVIEQQVQAQILQEALQFAKKVRLPYEFTLKELIAQGKVKKPQKPNITLDSVGVMLSKEYYNLGNLFFSELDVPDSAFFYYNEIVNNYSQKPVAVTTYFALGTYYETTNQKEKADSMFKLIYDNYPNHQLYNEAAVKLGKISKEEKKVAASGDPAESEYIAAEQLYYENKYHESINKLTHVYLTYPKSSFVPKAIYFIGKIYEDNLDRPDSAAIYYGILSSKEYSATPYGKTILAKYTEYKNEQDRIEKERQAEAAKQEAEYKKLLEQSEKDSVEVQQNNLNSRRKIIEDERIKKDTLNNKPGDIKIKLDTLNSEIDVPINKPDTVINKQVIPDRKPDSLKSKQQSIIDDRDTSKIKSDVLKKEDRRKQLFEEQSKPELKDSSKIKPDTLNNKEDLRKKLLEENLEPVQQDTTKKQP